MPGSSPEDVKDDGPAVEETKTVETIQDDGKETSAESSAAEKGDKGDMLAAVKAAMEPQTEKAPDSDEQGSKSDETSDKAAKEDGAETGEETDDLTEEELARLRPKTRKRIENLLRDRSERDEKIAGLEPKAQQFDHLVRFVEDSGLTKDEVNQGFDVMRNLKHDPLKAYAQLKPIIQQLQQIAGDVLPEDLQQAVSIGEITEAHARNLALARSQAAIATQQNERTTQRQQTERQRGEVQAHVDTVSEKVSEWERSKEKTDPDWKLKQPRVTELVELAIVRRQRSEPNYFPSVDEALKISADALTQVEKEFKALAPRRKPVNPVTEGASSRATSAPKTMLEAARQGLAKAAAG